MLLHDDCRHDTDPADVCGNCREPLDARAVAGQFNTHSSREGEPMTPDASRTTDTSHIGPITQGEPTARKTEFGWWADDYGIVGPYQPGDGPRSDPRDAFPTGPAVGDRLPDVVAMDQSGSSVSVHEARHHGPAVVVFSRATLW